MSNICVVTERLNWPRSTGGDVHTYNMMLEMQNQGHQLSLITMHDTPVESIEGLQLSEVGILNTYESSEVKTLSKLEKKLGGYWGYGLKEIGQLHTALNKISADVLIVLGGNLGVFLRAGNNLKRVWYLADEALLINLSRFRLFDLSSWNSVYHGLIHSLHEWAWSKPADQAWVVSPKDKAWLRVFSRSKGITVIPNGVDSKYYEPVTTNQYEKSCSFWGRLDFGPNMDALKWFVENVWPLVMQEIPDARFDVYGFEPQDTTKKLLDKPGINLTANLPDLREHVCRSSVAVMPFVSGRGIKNKLLEAAALERAIIATNIACNGLIFKKEPPFSVADRPKEWVKTLKQFWDDPSLSANTGKNARDWVIENHSWVSAAKIGLKSINQ